MKNNYEIVLNDIQINFKDSKYSTSQLLDNTGLDKKTARDAIKSKTQRSLSNYIRFYRLDHAQKLLKKGDKNVSEIAYDSGFSHISRFSEAYRKRYRVKPSDTLRQAI